MTESLTERYQGIKDEIANACQAANRPSDSVRLMAVSKTFPANSIRQLYQTGHRYFGENYTQELVQKALDLGDLDLYWSYIGAIQSNKIKKLVEHADEIQTVASAKHLKLIDRAASELGKNNYPVFLQVNLEGESTKQGISASEAQELAQFSQQHHHSVQIKGIMAIPSPTAESSVYQALRALADTIGANQLSLGMSGDLSEAIAAGSNIVRIGTGIFGSRS